MDPQIDLKSVQMRSKRLAERSQSGVEQHVEILSIFRSILGAFWGSPGRPTFADFRDFLGALLALLGAPAPDVAPGRDPRVSGERFGSIFGRFLVDFG